MQRLRTDSQYGDDGGTMQRTRCYYFYDTHARCNKRAPAQAGRFDGFNRIHPVRLRPASPPIRYALRSPR